MKIGYKNGLMRSVNLALYLVFCALVGTGSLLEWRLVPGREGGHGLTALGLGRHDWGAIHFLLGVIAVALIGAHLMLNWQWLKKIATKPLKGGLLGGLLIGVLIAVAIFVLPVH